MAKRDPNRKQAILEGLARELEHNPGARVTTARLAKAVGVSEAALYRHFPSKARMFEGLIEFAEQSIFARINQLLEDEKQAEARCQAMLFLLLGFAERNPGITRVLLGDALVGEHERLATRVGRFFNRVETQFRQILRETTLRGERLAGVTPETGASLLSRYVEGSMHQFLRSRFQRSPLDDLDSQWTALAGMLFGFPRGVVAETGMRSVPREE